MLRFRLFLVAQLFQNPSELGGEFAHAVTQSN